MYLDQALANARMLPLRMRGSATSGMDVRVVKPRSDTELNAFEVSCELMLKL